MEVFVPTELDEVSLFVLGMGRENVLIFEKRVVLSCRGETITTTEPETFLDISTLSQLRVVRIDSDVDEDGFYIEAAHVGL